VKAMTAGGKSGKGSFLFIFSTGIALAAIIGLVWMVILREIEARSISAEFEANRMASGLVEAFIEDPAFSDLGKSVLGFGLYAKDRSAIVRKGSAPASLTVEESDLPLRTTMRGGASFLLVRAMGTGALRGPGMSRGWQRLRATPAPPPGDSDYAPPPPPQNQPDSASAGNAAGPSPASPGLAPARTPESNAGHARYVWFEYSIGPERRKQKAELYLFAVFISLALVALYCYLLVLYRRNARLVEQDAKNRELVELGSAARTLVHEIKNPLAVIRIQTSAMRRQLPEGTPSGVEHASRLIDEEVDRLSNLSDRIREFLKSGEGSPKRVELAGFIGAYAGRFAAPQGKDSPGAGAAGIETGPVPADAAVTVDPERLGELLDNLVSNAKEAAPDSLPRIEVEKRGALWDISVLDRGAGIAPENAGRIFEPFFTTKEKGSGIGLALSRRIAESAGGSLAYRPRKGGGSIFTLSLPAA